MCTVCMSSEKYEIYNVLFLELYIPELCLITVQCSGAEVSCDPVLTSVLELCL